MQYHSRKATFADRAQILALYREVAKRSDGLARRQEEIDSTFIDEILIDSTKTGLIMALETLEPRAIVGVIHATGNSIRDLNHVMSQLTFLIHPDLQGRGLGKQLMSDFLDVIRRDYPHVYRVELRARSSNRAALGLYESLGFKREGLFKGRIRNREGHLEDGIPMVWLNPSSSISTIPTSLER